ncbi:MAG: sugar phosphate isomerase/epimerase family protein [Miltoncostaeaceae bacterium]|jgi:inosose dehydratase
MSGIGNAPVSFGIFGTTGGSAAPSDMLRALAASDYDGAELGPPGLFGTPEEAAALFDEVGLTAIGAYVPLHLALDEETFAADMERMAITCRELVATGGQLAILADEGSAELLVNPAREDRALALDDVQWELAAQRLAQAVELARSHGLAASFHPHISTYVESAWEVDRLLATTDVTLTLDIGHMALAGADPVACVHAWADRIDHVHIKDVDQSVLARAKRDGRTDFDEWWSDVCVPLGAGDVDIEGVLDALAERDYSGWLVVEQDRAPTSAEQLAGVAAQQAANRAWLAPRWARASAEPA